jgi:hypothetical protein
MRQHLNKRISLKELWVHIGFGFLHYACCMLLLPQSNHVLKQKSSGKEQQGMQDHSKNNMHFVGSRP